MTAPFIQAPTLPQVVSVYTLICFGRRIVAKGELTPDDAVEFRALMNRTSTAFDLPCEQVAVREAITEDMGAGK